MKWVKEGSSTSGGWIRIFIQCMFAISHHRIFRFFVFEYTFLYCRNNTTPTSSIIINVWNTILRWFSFNNNNGKWERASVRTITSPNTITNYTLAHPTEGEAEKKKNINLSIPIKDLKCNNSKVILLLQCSVHRSK